MEPKNKVVSFRPGFGKAIRDVDMVSFLTSDYYKDLIFKVRSAETKEEANELKKKLGAITPSGLFKGAMKDELLIKHSGFICLDIDAQDNPYTAESMKQVCCSLAETFLCGYSASGNGVFAIVRIDPNKHLESFEFLEHFFKTELNIVIDGQCKNLSRLRFATYDPEMYLNDEARCLMIGDWKKPVEELEYNFTYPERESSYDDFDEYCKNFEAEFAEGNRNRWIFHKAMQAKEKFEMSKMDCLQSLQRYVMPGFSNNELEQTVRSAYSN